MYRDKQRRESVNIISVDIKIYEAMLTFPDPKLKTKQFYIEVQSDEKVFQTEPKVGCNPKWNHFENITSKKGDFKFKLFEKHRL
jgi:hypothetical protein